MGSYSTKTELFMHTVHLSQQVQRFLHSATLRSKWQFAAADSGRDEQTDRDSSKMNERKVCEPEDAIAYTGYFDEENGRLKSLSLAGIWNKIKNQILKCKDAESLRDEILLNTDFTD